MKTVKYTVLFAFLSYCSVIAEQVLFEDDFENSEEGSLHNQALAAGDSHYNLTARSAAFTKGESRDSAGDNGNFLGRIYNNPGEENTAWITISKDLDAVPQYVFGIGYINFAGYGTLSIKAAGLSNDLRGSYQLTYRNAKKVELYYTDLDGRAELIGEVIPRDSQKDYSFVINNVEVRINGDTQELSVDGEVFGGTNPIEGKLEDGMPDHVRLHTQPTEEAFDIGIDNISAVAGSN